MEKPMCISESDQLVESENKQDLFLNTPPTFPLEDRTLEILSSFYIDWGQAENIKSLSGVLLVIAGKHVPSEGSCKCRTNLKLKNTN